MESLKTVIAMVDDARDGLVSEFSSFKIKAILFLSQIEYYTIYGKKLYANEVYCFYNDIQIDEFDANLISVDDINQKSASYDVINQFTALLEELSDTDVLRLLYQSQAFLKTNLARGNRLTKKILDQYNRTYSIYTNLQNNSRNQLIDDVEINYEFIDEIIDDLESFN